MKKVLIIDDSMFTRNIHAGILNELGFENLQADSGTSGIEEYKKEKPYAVIVDLLMPDMDGMDVIKGIKEFDENANIIICSTDRQKFRKQEGKDLGVEHFLNKPIDKDLLAEVLEKM